MTLYELFSKHNMSCSEINPLTVSFCGVLTVEYDRNPWFPTRALTLSTRDHVESITLGEALRLIPQVVSDELYSRYREECTEISRECEAEGYPSHGSNYELRAEALYQDYADAFPEYF